MRRILFAHTNFPAQFGAFGEWLGRRGWDVAFITQRAGAHHPTIRVVHCEDTRETGEKTHRYVRGFEQAVIKGQSFARAGVALARSGYVPDVVMAHTGWGAGMFLKDVWPDALYAAYFEWYYNWPHVDRTPYDNPSDPLDARARNRVRNAAIWCDFVSADLCLCPTDFQAGQFPPWLRQRLRVIHDGIDTELNSPGEGARAILARWNIPEDAEVVTSITRGMEPHRGFPEIMRAVERLQKARPRLHAVIGGKDRVTYGSRLPEGESWKARMLAELDLDPSRLHFTGLLPRRDMVEVMRASDAHLYLTVPFVLSWSLLDAMSVGCLIVASDTAPVREFMTHGETGLLVPLHDAKALATRVGEVLDAPDAYRHMRERARAVVVERLDAGRVIFPAREAMLTAALEARGPAGPASADAPAN